MFIMDETDGREDVKRKSRNLSEKKRRDQFNLLISELAALVTPAGLARKMDKSTVLRATIAFFKTQKDEGTKCFDSSDVSKGPSDTSSPTDHFKPSFLSNEEYTHLMLEGLDGFMLAVSTSGKILFVSESISLLLGHLPKDIIGTSFLELMPEKDQSCFLSSLSNWSMASNTAEQIPQQPSSQAASAVTGPVQDRLNAPSDERLYGKYQANALNSKGQGEATYPNPFPSAPSKSYDLGAANKKEFDFVSPTLVDSNGFLLNCNGLEGLTNHCLENHLPGSKDSFCGCPSSAGNPLNGSTTQNDLRSLTFHLRKGLWKKNSSENAMNISVDEEQFMKVHFSGYIGSYMLSSDESLLGDPSCVQANGFGGGGSRHGPYQPILPNDGSVKVVARDPSEGNPNTSPKQVLVGVVRLAQPQLLGEMRLLEKSDTEFVSRHSLEWKFLFLDQRAPAIIGYLPIEVLGTSGYDYYHVSDLERVAASHQFLMRTGKGTSCYYRFLTKGQQWIWLQSHCYISYHQWNSKPEFVVCTNTVVSYDDIKGDLDRCSNSTIQEDFLGNSNDSMMNLSSTSKVESTHMTSDLYSENHLRDTSTVFKPQHIPVRPPSQDVLSSQQGGCDQAYRPIHTLQENASAQYLDVSNNYAQIATSYQNQQTQSAVSGENFTKSEVNEVLGSLEVNRNEYENNFSPQMVMKCAKDGVSENEATSKCFAIQEKNALKTDRDPLLFSGPQTNEFCLNSSPGSLIRDPKPSPFPQSNLPLPSEVLPLEFMNDSISEELTFDPKNGVSLIVERLSDDLNSGDPSTNFENARIPNQSSQTENVHESPYGRGESSLSSVPSPSQSSQARVMIGNIMGRGPQSKPKSQTRSCHKVGGDNVQLSEKSQFTDFGGAVSYHVLESDNRERTGKNSSSVVQNSSSYNQGSHYVGTQTDISNNQPKTKFTHSETANPHQRSSPETSSNNLSVSATRENTNRNSEFCDKQTSRNCLESRCSEQLGDFIHSKREVERLAMISRSHSVPQLGSARLEQVDNSISKHQTLNKTTLMTNILGKPFHGHMTVTTDFPATTPMLYAYPGPINFDNNINVETNICIPKVYLAPGSMFSSTHEQLFNESANSALLMTPNTSVIPKQETNVNKQLHGDEKQISIREMQSYLSRKSPLKEQQSSFSNNIDTVKINDTDNVALVEADNSFKEGHLSPYLTENKNGIINSKGNESSTPDISHNNNAKNWSEQHMKDRNLQKTAKNHSYCMKAEDTVSSFPNFNHQVNDQSNSFALMSIQSDKEFQSHGVNFFSPESQKSSPNATKPQLGPSKNELNRNSCQAKLSNEFCPQHLILQTSSENLPKPSKITQEQSKLQKLESILSSNNHHMKSSTTDSKCSSLDLYLENEFQSSTSHSTHNRGNSDISSKSSGMSSTKHSRKKNGKTSTKMRSMNASHLGDADWSIEARNMTESSEKCLPRLWLSGKYRKHGATKKQRHHFPGTNSPSSKQGIEVRSPEQLQLLDSGQSNSRINQRNKTFLSSSEERSSNRKNGLSLIENSNQLSAGDSSTGYAVLNDGKAGVNSLNLQDNTLCIKLEPDPPQVWLQDQGFKISEESACSINEGKSNQINRFCNGEINQRDQHKSESQREIVTSKSISTDSCLTALHQSSSPDQYPQNKLCSTNFTVKENRQVGIMNNSSRKEKRPIMKSNRLKDLDSSAAHEAYSRNMKPCSSPSSSIEIIIEKDSFQTHAKNEEHKRMNRMNNLDQRANEPKLPMQNQSKEFIHYQGQRDYNISNILGGEQHFCQSLERPTFSSSQSTQYCLNDDQNLQKQVAASHGRSTSNQGGTSANMRSCVNYSRNESMKDFVSPTPYSCCSNNSTTHLQRVSSSPVMVQSQIIHQSPSSMVSSVMCSPLSPAVQSSMMNSPLSPMSNSNNSIPSPIMRSTTVPLPGYQSLPPSITTFEQLQNYDFGTPSYSAESSNICLAVQATSRPSTAFSDQSPFCNPVGHYNMIQPFRTYDPPNSKIFDPDSQKSFPCTSRYVDQIPANLVSKFCPNNLQSLRPSQSKIFPMHISLCKPDSWKQERVSK